VRVLAISHMFPSLGNERHGIFIARQAQALRRNGIELNFLVGRPYAPWPLYNLRRWRSYRTACSLVVPEGLSARPVRYLRPPGLWFRRFDGRSLARSLLAPAKRWHQEAAFDLVLGVSMLPDGEAAAIIGRRLGVPVVNLAVGSGVMVYPKQLPALEKNLRRTLEQTDLALGVSQSICNRLAEFGTADREPVRVYLGREGAGFAPVSDKLAVRRQLGWPADNIVALYVGGLVPAKGIGELVEACRRLPAKCKTFQLVCVGEGPMRAELAEAGAILTGRVHPEAVPTYVQAADFLVLPSHSEGMPQVVLEAMDSRLPVVATNVGGTPEAVIDGQTGLLVEPRNAEALRTAIQRMVTDTEFRIEAGRLGLERARTVFDSHRNSEILAQALKDAARHAVGCAPHTNSTVSTGSGKRVCSAHPTQRPKICILTTVHDPFDGRIFHKQAKSLAGAGYEVVLIAPADRDEIVDGVRIVALPKPKGRLARMTGMRKRLVRLALAQDADVYHFHDPELIPAGLSLKVHGKKVIWDVHEHYPNSIRDKFYLPKVVRGPTAVAFDLFERATVRFFDHVIYTTPLVGERYEKTGITSTSVENYPIIGRRLGVETDPQERIVYLGAMARARGLLEVLDGFSRVVDRHPSWQLDLIGPYRPPSFEKELRNLAHDRGIESNVNFVGSVPFQDKDRLLARAAIGIVTFLPNANNTSCLPNKLFEYMSMGLPVIASDFPLYREVIEPYQCGLIVDPTDPEAIAGAMGHLIARPEQARQMGRNGRLAVVERYNWQSESHKLLAVYESLLGAKARPEARCEDEDVMVAPWPYSKSDT